MKLDSGQIVLITFPHTNLKSGKKRPALVLTNSAYNEKSRDVVLAFVTSQPQSGKWSIPIKDTDLASGRLVLDSWIRVDRLATVEKRLVQGVVASLKSKSWKQVQAGLLELFGA